MSNIPQNFPITLFDSASSEKVSDTITRKRVAIFYKGENRNGAYISDEFAEKLIKTLPYAPIKGIYDADSEDFKDHGTQRTQGRVYGVVPENPNFAWENHEDEDGVEREYACADVYLFTALYKEAGDIAGKGQSMELYGPSIKGSWVTIDGKSLYKYTDACFLGLQVLGDNVIPCFEGASFFSLQEQQIYSLFTALLEKIESIGGKKVENENTLVFSLSDNQKQNAIFKALNPEKVRYYVFDTYDDYALVFDFETEKTYKVGYTKNEDDTVSVSAEMEEVYMEYVTKDEKKSLDSLRSRGTFSAIVSILEANETKINELSADIETKTGELSTLTTDKENLTATIEGLNTQIEQFNATISEKDEQIAALQTFKDSAMRAEKEAVIAKYSKKLSAETLAAFTDKIDSYTLIDLRKDLALTLVESNEGLFTLENGDSTPGYVPTEEDASGLTAILAKYKN